MWNRGRRSKVVLAALALALGGCIVTDEIDFRDAVNHPPELIDVEPSNAYIDTVCPELQTFTVEVWDADEDDAAFYGAQIYVRWTPGDTGSWNDQRPCNQPTEVAALEDGAEKQEGVRMRITCELPLEYYSIDTAEPYLLVMVRVSDRGFFQGSVDEGARKVEVLWALELLPDAACAEVER